LAEQGHFSLDGNLLIGLTGFRRDLGSH
jgi:hypothetical protein